MKSRKSSKERVTSANPPTHVICDDSTPLGDGDPVALVVTLAARALVILALVATRNIVSMLVGGVAAGLLSIIDLGEDLLDLLEGCGALDLGRRNTSKERGKGELYYRGFTVMGNSTGPHGGGSLRMFRGADQSVETALEKEKK